MPYRKRRLPQTAGHSGNFRKRLNVGYLKSRAAHPIVSKHSTHHELIARAIIIHNGALLVNQSSNAKSGQQYFALPGGHVDAGESCVQALERELREELEVEIESGDLCFVAESIYEGRKRNDGTRHELVLFFRATLRSELTYKKGRLASPEPKKKFLWLPLSQLAQSPLFPPALKLWLAENDLLDVAPNATPPYSFHDSTQNSTHDSIQSSTTE